MSSRVYAIIPAGAGLTRKQPEHARSPTPAAARRSGARSRPRKSSGTASTIASASAFCSATAFGTSSPSTTERYVRIANAMRNATVVESGGSMRSEISGSPMAPRRIAKIVIPTWTIEMKRTGSSMSRSAVSRAAAAALGALLEPRPPRGDQRVLGRHEDRVPQHEEEHDEDAEERRSRPVRGAGTRRDVVAHDDQAAV